ncbi:membrane protein insertase YidC [Candidatus Peregrinibacteria bacterium]|nr:membrane protein insertase YidC [Candidatus Peregrinibacteria bacterium]
MGKNILRNVVIFVAIFLALNLILGAFKGKSSEPGLLDKNEIGMQTDSEFGLDKTVIVELKNNTQADITIKNACPHNPLDVFKYADNAWQKIESNPKTDCTEAKDFVLPTGKDYQIAYDKWNHALFGELGKYKISLTIKTASATSDEPSPTAKGKKVVEKKAADKTFESNEFQVVEQSFWRKLWNNFFYFPIYNTLIFFTNILPFRDFGFAIIILTIIVRMILFWPSHRSMQSQKRMQEVQPEIDRLKEKYKGNQQMIGQETLRIFKENKVNPFGSCLPILIQFPFLIAIFYVVRNGLNADNAYMIYGFLKGFTLDNINVNFLGILDLTKQNSYVLPVIIGGLQFLQMKLSFSTGGAATKTPGEQNKTESKSVNKMMLYFMPVMIAIFTASVPAGVGIYWGASTLFSVGQQYLVNRGGKGKSEPTVKVITH